MDNLHGLSLLELASLKRKYHQNSLDVSKETANTFLAGKAAKEFKQQYVVSKKTMEKYINVIDSALVACEEAALKHKEFVDIAKSIHEVIKQKMHVQYGITALINHQIITKKRYSQIQQLIDKQLIHIEGSKFANKPTQVCSGVFSQFLSAHNNTLKLGLHFKCVQHKLNPHFEEFLCGMIWQNIMYSFTENDWALFLTLFMEKLCKTSKISRFRPTNVTWAITHKLRKQPDFNYANKMQIAFDTVINTSKKWQKMFGEIHVVEHLAFENDLAMLFDSSQWIYDYLKNTCGVILENRASNAAFTYYQGDDNHIVIRDCKGKLFET
eukprot:137248_1